MEKKGRRGGDKEDERGIDRSHQDGGRKSRVADAGGQESGRLRLKLHQLEKEKLELTAGHNQEVENKSKGFQLKRSIKMRICVLSDVQAAG